MRSWAGAVLALLLAALPAAAQAYPTHPITLIVPFPAGGGVDAVARIVAQKLSAAPGQQVGIDNPGGGGGGLGPHPRAQERARPPPPGRGAPRRLYAGDGAYRDHLDQSDALRQSGLRPAQGLHADR